MDEVVAAIYETVKLEITTNIFQDNAEAKFTAFVDNLHSLTIKSTDAYSKFNNRPILLAENIRHLEIMPDEGSPYHTFKYIYSPTLRVLVSKPILCNSRPISTERIKYVFREMNILSTFRRFSLHIEEETFCGICEFDHCPFSKGLGFKDEIFDGIKNELNDFGIDTSFCQVVPDRVAEKEEKINSPYFPALFDLFVDPSSRDVCILKEYMSQGSLQRICDKNFIPNDYNIVVVAFSVLSALEVLHGRNIVHGDINVSEIQFQ